LSSPAGVHQLPRTTDRRLVVAFLLLSAALSVLVLGFRNLSDDEILSLPFVTAPVSQIVAIAREGDVHPPGMYLLAHAAWRLIPSYRWLNLLPLAIFYLGLSVFLWQVLPRLKARRAELGFLMFATLHPQVLMWSNTFRWYCPWTGLALLAVGVALRPEVEEWDSGWCRAVSAGLLLAAMFYLSYITLLFALALGAALTVRLHGLKAPVKTAKLATAAVTFVLLTLPQLRTMVSVHLPNSRGQRSNVLVSSARIVQSITGSEAIVPWQPIAVLVTVLVLWLLIAGTVKIFRFTKLESQPARWVEGDARLRVLLVFSMVFFVLVALSGLGGKPRNGILLVPLLATCVGCALAGLRRRVQSAVLLLFGVWVALGVSHLIGRYGLQKANLNDRPEEVVALIRDDQSRTETTNGCSVVVTYDSGVAFALAQAHLPRMVILSPYRGALLAGTLTDVPPDCASPKLYVVESYRPIERKLDRAYLDELAAAGQFIIGQPSTARLSRDPDAALKRRLSRVSGLEAAAALPDYRFTVISGTADRARMTEMHRFLRHFVSGQGVLPDWPDTNQPDTMQPVRPAKP
jgi:hypothetical protein